MKSYRFLVEESRVIAGSYDLFKVYGNDSRGAYVGTISDKETLKLLIDAPAKAQLLANVKKIHPELALSTRDYSHRTLRDFAHAFVNYLRRLS